MSDPRVVGRWLRQNRVAVGAAIGLLALLLVVGTKGLDRYRVDHLGGTKRRITLSWSCTNEISWQQPGSSWRWWAGHDVPVGPTLATATHRDLDLALVQHWAEGTLVFDDDSHATFTSDNGGVIVLERESAQNVHPGDCRGLAA